MSLLLDERAGLLAYMSPPLHYTFRPLCGSLVRCAVGRARPQWPM